LLEQDEDMEEQFKASVENVSMICFLFEWNLVHNAKILTRYKRSSFVSKYQFLFPCLWTF
jgi:hypothetical protein